MDCIYEEERSLSDSGVPVVYYYAGELDSTMEPALLLAKTFSGSISVLRAEHQRAGRGRKPGRTWAAAPGENLLCTWAVPKELAAPPLHAVPLRAGLAAVQAVEQVAPELPVRLKWPNDIVVSGKKICGILCESKQSHVLIGIGLNVNRTAEAVPCGKFPPASLASETGRRFAVSSLQKRLTSLLLEALSSSSWREEIESRLYGVGRPMRFSSGQETPLIGRCEGIDSEGALLIQEGDRLHRMFAGEILEVRPKAGLEK